MWTETVASARPVRCRAGPGGISGGYDLFAQLLAEQRQSVDALIDQQRRCAEALLTHPTTVEPSVAADSTRQHHAPPERASHRHAVLAWPAHPGAGQRCTGPPRPGMQRPGPAPQFPPHDTGAAFACLLVGQPTLRRRMKLGVLAALDQRIGLRYAMPPMTPEETGTYLRHHVTLAGRSDALFSDDATALIHQTSRGYPRAVINLALQALVAAFAADKAIVD
jgi:hypothetical protein